MENKLKEFLQLEEPFLKCHHFFLLGADRQLKLFEKLEGVCGEGVEDEPWVLLPHHFVKDYKVPEPPAKDVGLLPRDELNLVDLSLNFKEEFLLVANNPEGGLFRHFLDCSLLLHLHLLVLPGPVEVNRGCFVEHLLLLFSLLHAWPLLQLYQRLVHVLSLFISFDFYPHFFPGCYHLVFFLTNLFFLFLFF